MLSLSFGTTPLMYNSIYPIHRRPLIVRIGTDYKYTKIAVDRVNAADGRYHVLFLGTDRGTVQKVVVLPTNSSASGELILEELEVFKNHVPITTMKISSKKQQLYVSSNEGFPKSLCIVAISTAQPVQTAAWQGTHTAPGMATPALGSTPLGNEGAEDKT